MNLKEFRDSFEFLYQSAFDQAPDINSYEISLCLTKAVDRLILEAVPSVDINESSRRLLHPLTDTKFCDIEEVRSDNSKFKKLKVYFPTNLQYSLRYAIVAYGCSSFMEVSFDKLDYLNETFKNPFRQPNKRKAIVISGGVDDIGRFDYVYVHKEVSVSTIEINYIRYNNPIIITNLASDDMLIGDESIRGLSVETETELTQEFHDSIVELAVNIAKTTLKI